MQTTLSFATPGPGLTEITRPVARWVADKMAGRADRGGSGLLTLFLRHTSASLLIQENADPTARADLETFFLRLVPNADAPAQAWMTHRAEGPDDMPAHLKAALLPTQLCVPVAQGGLALGTWQGLYLFEHRQAPQRRQVVLHLAPDPPG